MSEANEKDSLLKKEGASDGDTPVKYVAESDNRPSNGVRPTLSAAPEVSRRSFAQFSTALKENEIEHQKALRTIGSGMRSKSFTVSQDGLVSYKTPAEMGRQELYENLPMTAVMGLQQKERNMSMAFASFAADIDISEQEKTMTKSMSATERSDKKSSISLLLVDELNVDSSVATTPLIFAVLVATLAQLLVGYNTGVMNAPANVVFVGHSTFAWAIAVAAFAIGGPIGANIAGKLADSRGRRGALMLNTWTFLLGGILQTLALDMFTIIIARAIIGVASGFSSVLVPIYLGELAPPTLRGMLGTLTQFALVIGIFLADLVAFPFATVDKWRLLFAVTPVVASIQLLLASFLLESPRWLLGRDKDSKKARYIIKRLRGLRYDHEVETEAENYIAAQEAMGPVVQATFQDLLYDSKVRLLLVSSFVLQMAQQLSGINAVFYYSTSFFEGVIDDPLVGTTLVGGVNVVATYVALLLMDSVGRRTLILWSSGGMLVCCIVIIISLLGVFPNLVAFAAVNLYVTFFEIGLGPIPWLIVAEFFDAKYVAVAMSASSQINWGCNFMVGLTFPFLQKYLGPFSFLPFATVLIFTFMFTYYYLPETLGTSPEILQAHLVQKNSAVVYHNIDIENSYANPIDLEWKNAMDQLRKEEESAMKDGSYNFGFKPIQNGQASGGEGASSEWQSTMVGRGKPESK